eukprot:TRINITY_DN3700_c0_g1_i2.p1 TRINITY_DN3700_c0_g1~~TRINITY_DN3700_c0_g1_i2.p1  ORF type:complete len:678 (-),score=113.43 TRINITY_DN3700_c0_g1_i2:53-2086(-)
MKKKTYHTKDFITLPEGQYKGSFIKNHGMTLPHGEGELIYHSTQHRYIGYFQSGKREGAGQFFWRDGDSFDGFFVDGKPVGFGRFHFLVRSENLYEEFLCDGVLVRALSRFGFSNERRLGPAFMDGIHSVGEWINFCCVSGISGAQFGSLMVEELSKFIMDISLEYGLVSHLVQYCCKWYLDTRESCLVPAFPKRSSSEILPLTHVILKTKLLKLMTRNFLISQNESQNQILPFLYRICLILDDDKIYEVLEFIFSEMPRNVHSDKAVVECISLFLKEDHVDAMHLKETILIVEDDIKRLTDKNQLISEFTAIQILKLYRKEMKFLCFTKRLCKVQERMKNLHIPESESKTIFNYCANTLKSHIKSKIMKQQNFIKSIKQTVFQPCKTARRTINNLVRSIVENIRNLELELEADYSLYQAPKTNTTQQERNRKYSHYLTKRTIKNSGVSTRIYSLSLRSSTLEIKHSKETPSRSFGRGSNIFSRDDSNESMEINQSEETSVIFTQPKTFHFIALNPSLKLYLVKGHLHLLSPLIESNDSNLFTLLKDLLYKEILVLRVFEESGLQKKAIEMLHSFLGWDLTKTSDGFEIYSTILYIMSYFISTMEDSDSIRTILCDLGVEDIVSFLSSDDSSLRGDAFVFLCTFTSGSFPLRQRLIDTYGIEMFLHLLSQCDEDLKA